MFLLKFWLRLHPQIIPSKFKRCQWQDVSADRILGLDWTILKSCFFACVDGCVTVALYTSIHHFCHVHQNLLPAMTYSTWCTLPVMLATANYDFIWFVYIWCFLLEFMDIADLCSTYVFRWKIHESLFFASIRIRKFPQVIRVSLGKEVLLGSHCIVPRRKGGWGMVFVCFCLRFNQEGYLSFPPQVDNIERERERSCQISRVSCTQAPVST